MEAATQVSSFAKSLFLGEIHEELVFPFPLPDEDDQRRTRELVQQVRDFGEATTRARSRTSAGSATTRSPSSASAG